MCEQLCIIINHFHLSFLYTDIRSTIPSMPHSLWRSHAANSKYPNACRPRHAAWFVRYCDVIPPSASPPRICCCIRGCGTMNDVTIRRHHPWCHRRYRRAAAATAPAPTTTVAVIAAVAIQLRLLPINVRYHLRPISVCPRWFSRRANVAATATKQVTMTITTTTKRTTIMVTNTMMSIGIMQTPTIRIAIRRIVCHRRPHHSPRHSCAIVCAIQNEDTHKPMQLWWKWSINKQEKQQHDVKYISCKTRTNHTAIPCYSFTHNRSIDSSRRTDWNPPKLQPYTTTRQEIVVDTLN